MTASQARVLYMDDYIDFEHNIIGIANHISENNMFDVGQLCRTINFLLKNNFKIIKKCSRTLHKHRIMRNWLSHTLRDQKIKKKQIQLCQNISKINDKLFHIKNLLN